MKTEKPAASEFEFDFYDDLDIVQDGRIGVDKEGNVEYITLDVNGVEINITGEEADKIYEAIEVRVNNKRNNKILAMRGEAMVDKYENDLLERTETHYIDRWV